MARLPHRIHGASALLLSASKPLFPSACRYASKCRDSFALLTEGPIPLTSQSCGRYPWPSHCHYTLSYEASYHRQAAEHMIENNTPTFVPIAWPLRGLLQSV